MASEPVRYSPPEICDIADHQIEDIAQIMGWSKEEAMQKMGEFLGQLKKSVSHLMN